MDRTENALINSLEKSIKRDIYVKTEEVYKEYFLKNSDRKGYTIKMTFTYENNECVMIEDIQPFFSEEKVQFILEEMEKKGRSSLANNIMQQFTFSRK